MSTAGNPPAARAARLDTSAAATVSVRVSADLPGIARFIDALTAAAEAGGFEVTEPPRGFRAYPNRRDPGFRVYLALRFPPGDIPGDMRGAAHSHQAIRRPAATHSSRRQLP